MHRACNTLGLLAATASIIIAWQEFGVVSGGIAGYHKIIGMFVMSLSWLQLLGGVIRPHAPALGEKPTNLRTAWIWAHRVSGYSAIVLAQIVIFWGISLYNADYPIQKTKWQAGFLGWLALLVTIAFILELRACFCVAKKAPVKSMSSGLGSEDEHEHAGGLVHEPQHVVKVSVV